MEQSRCAGKTFIRQLFSVIYSKIRWKQSGRGVALFIKNISRKNIRNFAVNVMNTIPTTSKRVQTAYTVVGGSKGSSGRGKDSFSVILLNRGGIHHRARVFIDLQKLGIDEIFSIIDVRFYLDEELSKKETNLSRCYYHIDNFYHRIYVLEEMICRLISNILLHKSFNNKDEFQKELQASSYVDIKRSWNAFLKDDVIAKARKRRTKLVHRTGYSAQELSILWSMWNGTKRRMSDQSKESQERFCKQEYKHILKIIAKYSNFVHSLLLTIDDYLRV